MSNITDMDLDIENEKVTIIKDGIETNCDILFSFDSPDTNKTYVGYTDHSIDENGKLNIYSLSIDPVLGNQPENITDLNELKMVDDVIKEIQESVKE